MLYYCSKWEKSKDGYYQRTKETYQVKKMSEENIRELFTKDDITLQDILGEPVSISIEKKENVSIEELEQDNYFRGLVYSVENDDYIVVKETSKEKFMIVIQSLQLVIGLELAAVAYRVSMSKFDFKECVRQIKRKHKLVDVEELEKQLKRTKDSFNKLMR